jgi:hypothetical protein
VKNSAVSQKFLVVCALLCAAVLFFVSCRSGEVDSGGLFPSNEKETLESGIALSQEGNVSVSSGGSETASFPSKNAASGAPSFPGGAAGDNLDTLDVEAGSALSGSNADNPEMRDDTPASANSIYATTSSAAPVSKPEDPNGSGWLPWVKPN